MGIFTKLMVAAGVLTSGIDGRVTGVSYSVG